MRPAAPRTRWAPLALAATLGGCEAPSVRVRFDVPPPYRDLVATARLRVVAATGSPAIGCDDVAFGRIELDGVAGAGAIEVAVTPGGEASLVGIPREGDKLFVVEAVDALGSLVVAGCSVAGTIEDDLVVQVVAEPAATLTLLTDAPDETSLVATPPLPETVKASVRDALDAPLGALGVAWSVVGPAGGDDATGVVFTTTTGEVTIEPEATGPFGPVGVSLRPRWARAEPAVLRYLQGLPEMPLVVLFAGLDEAEGSARPAVATGQAGPAGEPGFFALNVAETEIGLTRWWWGSDGQAHRDDAVFTEDPPIVPGCVVEGPDGEVFAIAQTAWYGGSTTGAVDVDPTTPQADPLPAPPAFAVDATGCDGGDPATLVELLDGAFILLDPSASFAAKPTSGLLPPAGGRLLGSGCVEADDGSVHRVVALAVDDGGGAGCPDETVLALRTDGDGRVGCLGPNILVSPGFSRGTAGTSLLLLPVADAVGFSVGGFTLVAAGDDAWELERAETIETTFLVASPRLGRYDADEGRDLVGVAVTAFEEGGGAGLPFVSLARSFAGSRLVGYVPLELAGPAGTATRMVDFDGDGLDDVLIATRTAGIVALSGGPEKGP